MSKKSWLGLVGLAVFLTWLPSCGSDKACQGAEKCECYPNDTCNAGLACRSNTCVNLDPSAAGGASSTSVDTTACFACADKACVNEAAACKAASGCRDSLDCYLKCGPTDVACAANCGKGFTADSALKAVGYYTCATSQCLDECVFIPGSGGAGNSGGSENSVSAGSGNRAGMGSSAAGRANSGGTGGTGSVGRAGAPGRAGSGGGGNTADSSLGAPCTSSAYCGSRTICATTKGTLLGEGGPSGGMCTMACTIGSTECASLKVGAECFNFGTASAPEGYCLEACGQGNPAALDAKCSGRLDFVCADFNPGSTPDPYCVPHCRSDAECGSGLYCDQSNLVGLCKKTKHIGDPAGSACTPSATTNTCQGVCLRSSADGVTPETGFCVELCSAGGECLYGSGSSPVPGGYCGGALSENFGTFDLGYCLPNCSCSSDCRGPDNLCRKWEAANADIAAHVGAPGVCYPTVTGSVELSCGAGGAGGAGGGGPLPPKAGAGGSP